MHFEEEWLLFDDGRPVVYLSSSHCLVQYSLVKTVHVTIHIKTALLSVWIKIYKSYYVGETLQLLVMTDFW